MNRLIAILIAVCYMCASTGFTLHEHYCMGEHVSTSLWAHGDTHACAKCGMKKGASQNDCCKDEHKVMKADGDATLAKAFVPHSPAFDAIAPEAPVYSFERTDALREMPQSVSGKPHGPPLLHPLRLHVRNCVFLI